jgi:hypothetical protein
VVASSGQAPTIANANASGASFVATDNAWVTVRLTVTDSQGAQDASDVTVNGPAPVVSVNVSPGTATVRVAGGTQAFTATVTNSSNTAVTWQVNGVTGGNATVGTISTSGLYTAPATVPSSSTVLVKAISQADNTRSDTAQVTLTEGSNNGGGGGGGGGGVIDAAWLLIACVAALASRRARRSSQSPGVAARAR